MKQLDPCAFLGTPRHIVFISFIALADPVIFFIFLQTQSLWQPSNKQVSSYLFFFFFNSICSLCVSYFGNFHNILNFFIIICYSDLWSVIISEVCLYHKCNSRKYRYVNAGLLMGNSNTTRETAVCDMVIRLGTILLKFWIKHDFLLISVIVAILENSLDVKTMQKCFVYTCKKLCLAVAFP